MKIIKWLNRKLHHKEHFSCRWIWQLRTWRDLEPELLKVMKEALYGKVKFSTSPRYYTITSGHKTWYWIKETGEFDGTSWDVEERKELLEVTG